MQIGLVFTGYLFFFYDFIDIFLISSQQGFFSLGRFVCIPIAFFVASKTMLSGNVVCIFIFTRKVIPHNAAMCRIPTILWGIAIKKDINLKKKLI